MNKKIMNIRILASWMGLFLLCILCPFIYTDTPENQTPGLGDAASSLLESYSPDAFMDELMNSPLISDKDREELANLSPEEQAELFEGLMGFFNDPEVQKVLNDPKFMEDVAKLDEMMTTPDVDWDSIDFDSMFKPEDSESEKKEQPPAPKKDAEVVAPTKEACQRVELMLKKIIEHLNSLERKASHYDLIQQYFTAFRDTLNEFRFYAEVLQKQKNVERLASDEFKELTRSLCGLLDILDRYEPEIPFIEVTPEQLYNPYEILGVPRSATMSEIEARYEKLEAEKSPEHVKERLAVAGADEKKMAKKIKEAELIFTPIKKAYEDLLDSDYREEINRILDAERRKQEGVEGLTRMAIEHIMVALDDALIAPGTILHGAKELLARYDAEALQEFEKRREAEKKAAQKVEEFQKHPAARPAPMPNGGYNGYPTEPYINHYRPGDYYDYQPDRPGIIPGHGAPGQPSAPKPGDTKKPDDKKKDGKKPGDKKTDDKKKPAGPIKPEQLTDKAAMSIKDLDVLLTAIERGKEEEEKKPDAKPADAKPAADAKDKDKDKGEKPDDKADDKKDDKKEEKPKAPAKATAEEKKKLVEEVNKTINELAKDAPMDVLQQQKLDDELKALTKRLRLKELNLKTENVLVQIERFYESLPEKTKNVPPAQRTQLINQYKASHKKLIDGLFKEHEALLANTPDKKGAFKQLTELTGETFKNVDKRNLYFKRKEITADGKEVEVQPANKMFVEVQDQAREFLAKLDIMKQAFSADAAKKQADQQKAGG